MSLVKVIKDGSLIKNFDQKYDIILSDFDFTSIINNKNFIHLKNDFEEVLSYYISKNNKILLILDKICIDSLFHILSVCKNISILDLNTGLYEKGNKFKESVFDITSLLSINFDIYEPTDILCLEKILSTKVPNKKILIKLNNNETTGDNLIGLNSINSLQNRGYDGEVSTLLIFGTYWIELIKGLEDDNNLKKIFSVFVANKINFILNEEIIDNIKKTKNIFIIVDMKNILLYENYVKGLFYTNKLYDIKIKFILPEYSKLTTIIDEYRLEEVYFNGENIVKRIIN